jgi:hypothetical protein
MRTLLTVYCHETNVVTFEEDDMLRFLLRFLTILCVQQIGLDEGQLDLGRASDELEK